MNAEEWISKAVGHQEDGAHADAAAAFLRAFELAPTDARLPWEAGRIFLYFANDAAAAVRAFEAALPLLTDTKMIRETRYHLGLAHTFLKDDAKAAPLFELVLLDTPTHVLACIELGKLRTRTGDRARAEDLLKQAVLHNQMRSTMPEMFPDGDRGSAHQAALAWMNLGRLAVVAGEDDELGSNAAGHLLDDLDDRDRVFLLAKEAREAGNGYGALVVIDQILRRKQDDEEAATLWFTIALDELAIVDDVVEGAKGFVEDAPAWGKRMIAEVLKRQPDHAEALVVKAQFGA